MNIYSGSSEGNGLAAALTNPTELAFRKGKLQQKYPVTVDGRTFMDAEAAYKAAKRDLTFRELQSLMVRVLVAKLQQHRRLWQAIAKQGGVEWLETCSHSVNGGRWEGVGRKSAFIRCLIAAYEELSEVE